MDDADGGAVAALQIAQESEQWCDLAGDVFVDAMQAHERVEDQQAWLQPGDGVVETGAVGVEIEPEAWRGNDLDVETGKAHACRGADTVEPPPDDVQRILGGVKQHAAGPHHAIAAQAGSAGGDGDRHVQGEEGLAAFGLAADDADGLLGPQPVDQPAPLFGAFGEMAGAFDGELAHRSHLRRPAAGLGVPGAAHVSKNKV